MSLCVGYGNSIMFRELNEQLPSFDNTPVKNEKFVNTLINRTYSQQYFTGDTIVIQVKVATGDTPNMERLDCSGHIAAVSKVKKSSYTDYDFWEFTDIIYAVDLDKIFVYTAQNAPVIGSDKDWESEPVEIISEISTYYPNTNISRYLLLEWFNKDATTGRANNNFEMDYDTDIVPFMRIECKFKDYEPKSEISVYENLDEVTKLKEKVQRTLELKTDAVPRFLTEKLTIATAHDNFYVNKVAFVREDKAEVNTLESNLAEFSAVLTQQNVIGLNTSDIGFNCDAVSCKITNLEELAVTSNKSYTVPEGYLLQTITAVYNSGTNIYLEFGTGVGLDDIAKMRPTATASPLTTTKNVDYAPSGDTTLYLTVSGTTPNVDIHILLIENRQ